MTSRNAIAELYQSREFNDCIGKMEPRDLQGDLRAEVALILLETDEQKIIGMYERDELRYYAVRIIMNLIKSTTSRFYKMYRQPLAEIDVNRNYDVKHRNAVVDFE